MLSTPGFKAQDANHLSAPPSPARPVLFFHNKIKVLFLIVSLIPFEILLHFQAISRKISVHIKISEQGHCDMTLRASFKERREAQLQQENKQRYTPSEVGESPLAPPARKFAKKADAIKALFDLGFDPLYPGHFEECVRRKEIDVNMPDKFLEGYNHGMKSTSLVDFFKRKVSANEDPGSYSFLQGFRYSRLEAKIYHNVTHTPRKMSIKTLDP